MANFRSVWTIAALLALFVALLLTGGPANAGDVAIVQALQHFRTAHPATTGLAATLTMFGSAYATIGSGLLATLWLAARRHWAKAGLLIAGIAFERFIADGMKLLVDRPRPHFGLHPVMTTSSSFPSGHSANSMAAFLMIALTLAPPAWRRPAAASAIVISMVMGLTRPYLGVHWPTDVLGGWALGLMMVWIYLLVGERSGAIEQQHQVVGRHGPPLDQAEAMR